MKKFLCLVLVLITALTACSKEPAVAPESNVPEETSTESLPETSSEPESRGEPVTGEKQYFIETPSEGTEFGKAFNALVNFVENRAFAYFIPFDFDGEMTDEQKLILTFAAINDTDEVIFAELP